MDVTLFYTYSLDSVCLQKFEAIHELLNVNVVSKSQLLQIEMLLFHCSESCQNCNRDEIEPCIYRLNWDLSNFSVFNGLG